ncbi:acetyl/propionyl/methylcrotonyl-CoA carboxylase subunit alpha [Corynebacterium alimapuense]|uniref:biotin carboxylase n=1 Tax=Corynebacterium alimapuense TaxID=1576874 RepID=A0A3M8K6E2_9CORY|nr:biotin carboxylase N-terminal domain-containing protein [Corynebacterium alimapuense]RNE48439.1 acetyl/propionyl-CoA carboxylase subunit alpha [Corynebacterium alimapuense]
MSAPTSLKSVLIANRGEIAVRIARVARDLGIRSIAVYAEPDAGALHTLIADEAYALPGSESADTYLNIPALLDVAARAGADCLHPGYGFLSENADFARAVTAAGMTWIGPTPENIETLGDKVAARAIALAAGAPLAPGTPEPIQDWQEAQDFAEQYGLPIAIKAAFGGGGRGLKVVENAADIEDAFLSAGREAREAFGRGECFVEKFLTRPRHVEAQVLADTHGNVRVLGTRDCSTQRRYQKLIEEAPAPFLSEAQNQLIIEGARDICLRAGYVGAGTVEYIVSEDGTVSFLEVNTRVQVEHPVTEAVTGIDIIAEQFRIADGQELELKTDPQPHGHAFEFRLNAEDVAQGFVPSPGTVTTFAPPTGPGIRVDSGVQSGSQIPGFYDSLLAKLIVWGPNRQVALRRAEQALAELKISGVRTVVPFHRDLVTHPDFCGDHLGIHTTWVDQDYVPGQATGIADIEDAYTERESLVIEIDGRLHQIGIPTGILGRGAAIPTETPAHSRRAEPETAAGAVLAPFAGSLVAWKVADGETVKEGQPVATVEAMKMESVVTSPSAGTIALTVSPGEKITKGDVLGQIS